MISNKIINFLTELDKNNNREWFHANKPFYNDAKQEFENTTLKLISLVNEVDSEIGFLEPKDCIFRIYRDTRFSHNKTPYKNNFGAYVNRGGKKSPFAGYYLHIQPEGSFIASGIHMPDSKVLYAVRQEILHFTEEYKSIINNKTLQNLFGGIVGDKLKMAPKGFDKTFKDIDLLKFKSFNLIKYLTDDELLHPMFEDRLKELYQAMLPLNRFFNRVISDL